MALHGLPALSWSVGVEYGLIFGSCINLCPSLPASADELSSALSALELIAEMAIPLKLNKGKNL